MVNHCIRLNDPDRSIGIIQFVDKLKRAIKRNRDSTNFQIF